MLYEKLVYNQKITSKEKSWIANDRWYALEDVENNCYALRTAPFDLQYGQLGDGGAHVLLRTLLYIKPERPLTDEKAYGTDYIKAEDLKLYMPYGKYGAFITAESGFSVLGSDYLGLCHENGAKPQCKISGKTAVVSDGTYTLVIKTEGEITAIYGGVKISGSTGFKTVIAFYNNADTALELAEAYLADFDGILAESRSFWEEYLNSCPVVESKDESLVIRQYWHWWVALVNVSYVEFNKFPLYMAPDRDGWLGTWSNDGPETMAALSLTNQRDIARQLIISYTAAAINNEGIHSWYLHSNGTGCYGNPGDVGLLSHGVPNIIHTVDFYVRNTGDKTILTSDCGGETLYARISRYFRKLLALRDLDGDGLIEWRNLWETGWDDKLGCFFKSATLSEWCDAVSTGTKEEIKAFYEKNSYPVAAVVEQVYTRWAAAGIKNLAGIMNDPDTAQLADEADRKIESAMNNKCWNETDGFYYDYSIRDGGQIKTKGADCFYYMYFEKNAGRIERVCREITNPDTFGSYYIPMQAINSEGFSPTGYWSGGHWPREMSYLSMGLNKAGKGELAEEICKKAIMSGEGNNFYEVKNPITGEPTTGITKMAYIVMDVVALLDINGKIGWTE